MVGSRIQVIVRYHKLWKVTSEMKFVVKSFFIILCMVAGHTAHSADFLIERKGNGVIVSGEIKLGDYQKFRNFLIEDENNLIEFLSGPITLDSPGGAVIESMKIANLIEQAFATTIVQSGGRCFSACVFLWASGVNRMLIGSAKLGFHRISLSNDELSVAKSESAILPIAGNVSGYLMKMGIPRTIVDKMMETSSSDIYIVNLPWLISAQLDDYIQYRPSFIDIVQKQCGVDPVAKSFKGGPKPLTAEKQHWWDCEYKIQLANRKENIRRIGALVYAK